jgi:hypothetical protein
MPLKNSGVLNDAKNSTLFWHFVELYLHEYNGLVAHFEFVNFAAYLYSMVSILITEFVFTVIFLMMSLNMLPFLQTLHAS